MSYIIVLSHSEIEITAPNQLIGQTLGFSVVLKDTLGLSTSLPFNLFV